MDHLARRVALRFSTAGQQSRYTAKELLSKTLDVLGQVESLEEYAFEADDARAAGSDHKKAAEFNELKHIFREVETPLEKAIQLLQRMWRGEKGEKLATKEKLMGSLGSGKTGSNVNRIATSSASTLYKTLATSLDVAIDLFESVEKGSAGEALAREAMNGLHQTLEALKKFEHLRTSPRTAEGPHTTGKVAAGEVNVPKLDRLVESIEKEVKQMRTSLDLYTKDPGKYKPQLDNLANAASTVGSTVGVIHRLIDKA